jgi:hypothetical protein
MESIFKGKGRATASTAVQPSLVQIPGQASALDLDERDHERVKDERLDQRKTNNHRNEDLSLSSRVARDAFKRGSCRFTLAESATGRSLERRPGMRRHHLLHLQPP